MRKIKGLLARLSRLESPEEDCHNSSTPPTKESLKAQAIRRTTHCVLQPGVLPANRQVIRELLC